MLLHEVVVVVVVDGYIIHKYSCEISPFIPMHSEPIGDCGRGSDT